MSEGGVTPAGGWRHATGELDCSRARLVGILNASPDSFSDASGSTGPDQLLVRGLALAAAGADVVEVGGQTLRDTAAISVGAEVARVAPVIERLSNELAVPIAVDTFSADVAEAALAAGASIVNDPTGLRDPRMADVAARGGAGVVLTHFLGPTKRVPALYPDVDIVDAIRRWAGDSLSEARAAGLGAAQVAIDPGIGLGTSPFQDLEVLRRLEELSSLGRPVFLPISNKKVLGAITGASPGRRRAGTAAALAWGIAHGARIFRVHDVGFMRDVVLTSEALASGRPRVWHFPPG